MLIFLQILAQKNIPKAEQVTEVPIHSSQLPSQVQKYGRATLQYLATLHSPTSNIFYKLPNQTIYSPKLTWDR